MSGLLDDCGVLEKLLMSMCESSYFNGEASTVSSALEVTAGVAAGRPDTAEAGCGIGSALLIPRADPGPIVAYFALLLASVRKCFILCSRRSFTFWLVTGHNW